MKKLLTTKCFPMAIYELCFTQAPLDQSSPTYSQVFLLILQLREALQYNNSSLRQTTGRFKTIICYISIQL